jgi:hypothetical protein
MAGTRNRKQTIRMEHSGKQKKSQTKLYLWKQKDTINAMW